MFRNAAAVEREVHDLVATLRASGARLAELLADGALGCLPDAVLPDLVVDLRAACESTTAATTGLVSRIHAGAVPLPDGHVSVTRWLQAATRCSSGTAKQLIARGRSLDADYSATRDAWLAGNIGGDHARVISCGIDRAVRSLPAGAKEDRRAEAEDLLLRLAAHLTPDDLAKAAAHLRFILNPAGADQDEIDDADAQAITFARVGDGVEVKGFLAAETAALIRTALDQVVDGWYRRGELPAGHLDLDEQGRPLDPDDPKAARARRLRRPHLDALALAHMAGRLLEAGDLGGKHGAIPRITLTADLASLDTLGGELHDPHHETPAPVAPHAMLRLLCDAAVTVVITGCATGGREGLLREAAREVLFVGREERTITRAQRAALAVIYPHCAFTGCRVPASRCHAHHVTHWTHGGTTDPDNLVLLCHAHHRSVHHAGWTITATGGDPLAPGYWAFAPPDRTRP